jgi:hypothetical protein
MFRQSEGSTIVVGVACGIVGSFPHVQPVTSADHLSAQLDDRVRRLKWSHVDDDSCDRKCDLRKCPYSVFNALWQSVQLESND